MTGLAVQDAQRAQQREATEPLLWLDEQNALPRFCQLLAEAGLVLTQGGRFYHAMSAQTSKGFMVNWIKKQYVEKYGTDVKTLGLGDGPNFFSRLPHRHRILWNDGPRLKALSDELAEKSLAPEEPGKGRNVWFCVGYTLVSRRSDCVALHDCDIVTYDRAMLARLLYPVANPHFNYDFCKGYYARVAEGKLNGRVGRLLVYPLLKSQQKVYGNSDYLDYMRSYRYPLSCEFAMRTTILNNLRIPGDWGLEIGVLSEIYRGTATRRICQVDIADRYDHKHQPMSEDDPNAGLQRMAADITKALYRKLAILGVNITTDSFRVLRATYYRTALDMIDAFEHDARMNGLTFDHLNFLVLLFYINLVLKEQCRRLCLKTSVPDIPYRRTSNNKAHPFLMD
ncbi:hypothetical protein [Pectobacterium brasiliense]|uniref:hypothetical protein n=1 Tax=Pectobacterium brasiliense TaxID=180957 RepID=UPI001F0880DB|nr:hypothetical protein [Pectobacterium brasiliense]